MRRVLGVVALALGVLLIVGAALVKWVAAPALIKIPLDVDSVTVSEGGAQVFVLSQQTVASVPVVATRAVRGDKAAGTSSVAVWNETLCLRSSTSGAPDRDGCVSATDPGFLQKTTDRVAFDRKSALPVNEARFKATVNGVPVVHDGLGYTFPLGTKKQTYPFFDTVLNKSFPMTFVDTEKVNGLSVYKFAQTVPESDIKINSILPGRYSNVRTVWVEPTTGVIVKGSEQIVQKFAATGGTAFNGTIVFNDATVKQQVKYAKDHITQINVVRTWAPLALLVLGVLLVVAGVLLVLRRRPAVERVRDDQVVSSQT